MIENAEQSHIRRVAWQHGRLRYAASQAQTTLMPVVTPISDAIRVLSIEEACRSLHFAAAGFCLAYYDRLPADVVATLNALDKAANGQLTRRATLAVAVEFFERHVIAANEDIREALRAARLTLATLHDSSAKLAAIKAEEANKRGNWLL